MSKKPVPDLIWDGAGFAPASLGFHDHAPLEPVLRNRHPRRPKRPGGGEACQIPSPLAGEGGTGVSRGRMRGAAQPQLICQPQDVRTHIEKRRNRPERAFIPESNITANSQKIAALRIESNISSGYLTNNTRCPFIWPMPPAQPQAMGSGITPKSPLGVKRKQQREERLAPTRRSFILYLLKLETAGKTIQ